MILLKRQKLWVGEEEEKERGAEAEEGKKKDEGIAEPNTVMMERNRRSTVLHLLGTYLISPGNWCRVPVGEIDPHAPEKCCEGKKQTVDLMPDIGVGVCRISNALPE